MKDLIKTFYSIPDVIRIFCGIIVSLILFSYAVEYLPEHSYLQAYSKFLIFPASFFLSNMPEILSAIFKREIDILDANKEHYHKRSILYYVKGVIDYMEYELRIKFEGNYRLGFKQDFQDEIEEWIKTQYKIDKERLIALSIGDNSLYQNRNKKQEKISTLLKKEIDGIIKNKGYKENCTKDDFFKILTALVNIHNEVTFPQKIIYDEEEQSVKIITYKKNGFQRQKHKEEMFFKNGVKRFEQNYKNGLKHGKLITWLPNGNTMSIINYKEGKKHGLDQMYDAATGKLFAEGEYNEGVKKIDTWKFYDQQGAIVENKEELDFALEVVGSIIEEEE